jgi:hypothetical protein
VNHVFTVTDNTKPTATAPTTVDLECASALPGAASTIAQFLALAGANAGDNCTAQGSLLVSSNDVVTQAGSCNGVITRTYTITDGCGNTTTVNHVFTVTDNTKPTVSGSISATTVEGCTTANAPGAVNSVSALEALTGNLQVGDNCTSDGSLVVTYSDQSSGSCPITITRTYTISDACGNTNTAVHLIYVDDNTKPTASCKNITVQLGSGGTVTILPSALNNGSSDNCTAAGSLSFSASQTTFDCDDLGPNTITLTVSDACGNTDVCTSTVTVESCTQTTAKVSAPSVRYQDEVTLYAEITANSCAVGSLTGNVKFYLDGDSVGIAAAYPIPYGETGYPNTLRAAFVYKVKKLPKDPLANYEVKAIFIPTTTYYCGPSQGTTNLLIKPREATYLGTGFYTGDVFVWTPTETSSTGTVLLAATIKDANTPNGDVRGARVTFYYYNAGIYTPIPSATNLPVNLVNLQDGTVGVASATIQLNIGNQNSASWTIAVGVSGGYINRKTDPTAIALVTVAKPVPGGFICGGGEMTNTTASNGWIRGAVGQTTCFSMDVKFTNKLTNPQGKVNNIIIKSWYKPDGTLDNVLHTYLVNSTAISVFAVGQTPSKRDATFTSKSNLIEVFDGYTVSIEGGINLQLSMTDNGVGTTDKLAITLYRKNGGIWFYSNWDGTKAIEQLLSKGNIYVSTSGLPQSVTSVSPGGMKSTAEVEQQAIVVTPLTAKAFPNPSETHFNLFVESGNAKDDVEIQVYNTTGVLVHQAKGTSNRSYKFGEGWVSGMYFVQVRQGDELKTLQLMKQ